jgi:hypothetical protein
MGEFKLERDYSFLVEKCNLERRWNLKFMDGCMWYKLTHGIFLNIPHLSWPDKLLVSN